MQENKFDVVIIGGGLAGLCASIHLAKHQLSVVLIEKNRYPKHKVCGEYVSNEVLPYLKHLGFDPFDFGAKKISKFELTTPNNKSIHAQLPLGGFGISRYEFDFQLYQLAKKSGVTICFDTVEKINFKNNAFTVTTKNNQKLNADILIGAFGKRSNLDVHLNRTFIKEKSPYLSVKIHVKGTFAEDKVALHYFNGGYCGVSKVENNHINLCYITDYKSFKKYKSITVFQKEVLFKNNVLKAIFTESKPQFEKPLSISQISFTTKTPVEQHILMCGDTAGMIHPLCGNGMAMAIKSAYLVSNAILKYCNGKLKTRVQLENDYTKQWKKTFSFRLRVGHTIAFLFRQHWLAPKLLTFLSWFPFLIPLIIKMTHGKPMTIK